MFCSTFEEALPQKTATNFMIARQKGDGPREFAVIPFEDIQPVISAGDGYAWYEVVTDNKCYLHLVLRAPEADAEQEALYAEAIAAVQASLPDVQGLSGMQTHVSVQEGTMRVVYRDVVLGGLDAAREIAKAVSVRAEADPETYPLLSTAVCLDGYSPGHCVRLAHGSQI